MKASSRQKKRARFGLTSRSGKEDDQFREKKRGPQRKEKMVRPTKGQGKKKSTEGAEGEQKNLPKKPEKIPDRRKEKKEERKKESSAREAETRHSGWEKFS